MAAADADDDGSGYEALDAGPAPPGGSAAGRLRLLVAAARDGVRDGAGRTAAATRHLLAAAKERRRAAQQLRAPLQPAPSPPPEEQQQPPQQQQQQAYAQPRVHEHSQGSVVAVPPAHHPAAAGAAPAAAAAAAAAATVPSVLQALWLEAQPAAAQGRAAQSLCGRYTHADPASGVVSDLLLFSNGRMRWLRHRSGGGGSVDELLGVWRHSRGGQQNGMLALQFISAAWGARAAVAVRQSVAYARTGPRGGGDLKLDGVAHVRVGDA